MNNNLELMQKDAARLVAEFNGGGKLTTTVTSPYVSLEDINFKQSYLTAVQLLMESIRRSFLHPVILNIQPQTDESGKRATLIATVVGSQRCLI